MVTESFGYKQLSASANVSAAPAVLGGIFCSASTSGTVTVYDDAATGTTTKIVDTFSLTAGTFYRLPFGAGTGLYIVIGGTASITVGFNKT
jgi:hypothetical protein